ncbi:MAG: C40 family peptidase [Burkholderiales bacterium]|nr:C40 family peptidase [Burkholderiales bacterium]MBH2016430.1 C40 family peptidase [Burkholderiales bacterium]
MPFTTRHPVPVAEAPGHTAGPGSQRIASFARHTLAGLALVFGLLPAASLSQQVTPLAQTPPTSPAATASAPESDDPVARFLSEKGLIPSRRPVTELAQQVRETATDLASDLVLSAMNFLGVPYKRGGNSSETGFDCSGFTRHVFENSVGLILPRRASEQAQSPSLVPVQQAELKPGDLVFFNTLRRTFSHVGIYIGDNKFIHSPRAGGQVRVEDMRQAYWQQRFDGARRAPAVTARPANN